MNPFLLATEFPGADQIGQEATAGVAESASTIANLAWNPVVLLAGIGLVVVAIVIIFFLKKVIINSILGLAAWAIAYFVFGIEMPFFASLAVSIIFGLAGIGVMLVLVFMGVL